MRKPLQIAVTAVALATCLALVALWVRSNSTFDQLWIPVPFGRKLGLLSLNNCVSVSLENNPDGHFYFASSDVGLNANLQPRTYWGFLFVREPGVTYGYVPFWFLVAIVAGVAAAPWLRWRFRVRTLLIAMTVVAAIFSLAVAIH